MFIEGFYNAVSNEMIGDTVKVNLRNNFSLYNVVDSASAFVSSTGQRYFIFSNAANGIPFYIEIVHRNSKDTWSKTAQPFTFSALSFDFTTGNTKAFGDNMIQVDT